MCVYLDLFSQDISTDKPDSELLCLYLVNNLLLLTVTFAIHIWQRKAIGN